MKNLYKTLTLALLLTTSTQSKAIALVDVDIELQLLVDISGSINSNEYDMQLQGYANAFASDRLQNAIINGTQGQIAVQLIMWSGASAQDISIDWTLVDSIESANALATDIAAIARPFAGWTAIGSAIEYAYPLFDSNEFNGTKQIIDISGDGRNNNGVSPDSASQNAINAGVDTINGIVITQDQRVVDQYLEQVVNGDSPFLLNASDFSEFQQAIEDKIVAEIDGTVPTQNIVSVPEPSTWLLFSIGGVFIVMRRFAKEK